MLRYFNVLMSHVGLLAVFLAFALSSHDANSQVFVQHGTCKPITPELVVFPGNRVNYKATTLRAKSAVLTTEVSGRDVVLNLKVIGTDVMGQPLNRQLLAILSETIGSDYRAFFYSAKNATDDLRSVRVEIEVLERDMRGASIKGLMSILAATTGVDIKGNPIVRNVATRFLCEAKGF